MACTHCATVHRNGKALMSLTSDVCPLVSPYQKETWPDSFLVQRCETGSRQKNRFLVINSRPGLESVSFLTEDQALS